MRSKFSLILPALVLLNLLVKGTSMYRNRTPWFVMPGYMDLVMFYNTSQPIWTVMSTDTSNLTCQADKMYNITYEYVVFERFYKIYENISDFYLLGRFTNWNTQPDRWPNSRRPRYDQMVLSYLGFQFEFGSDILLYYHEHCAVFRIIREKGERMWLELRAWNFTVSGISILCTTYFYQHQRHKERTVYTPDCQHILEPVMNRSVSSWRRRRSAT
uniref:Lipocalin n=1 Tax=Rhipicephalus appendiculatus TaxID=34631 RepID=A0A131YR90_RHIAP